MPEVLSEVRREKINALSSSAARSVAQKSATGAGVVESQVFAKFETPMGLISFVMTSFDGKYVLLSDIDGQISIWSLKTRNEENVDYNIAHKSAHESVGPLSQALSSRKNSYSAIESVSTTLSSPYIKSNTVSRIRK